jgi:8-oxo-dGTP pyrophosphatase MutT (NUDIX family)
MCMDKSITGSGALFYSLTTKRFLLLHRTQENKQCWGLVGGKIEGNESPWQGLQREISEEIGTCPDIIKSIPLETFISNDEKFHFYTYLCVIKEEFIPTLNDEHDGYAWVAYEQWPKPLHSGLLNTVRNKIGRTKLKTVLQLIEEFIDI